MSFARRFGLLFCLTATPAFLAAGFLTGSMGAGPGVGAPGFGGEFGSYYMAGMSAARGEAIIAYDLESYGARTLAILGRDDSGRMWPYPPTLFFLLIPFGLLSLSAALYAWTALNAAALAAWSATRARTGALGRLLGPVALIYPASLLSLVGGQIGCLFAGLTGAGLLLLERRPLLAGVLIGLAGFKPQLGILLPVALLAGGYWRVFAAASATVLALIGASTMVFGSETWWAQFANMEAVNAIIAEGRVPLQRMVTVASMAQLLGLAAPAALAVQACVSAAMAALVAWVWRRPGGRERKISVLIVATYLAAPYGFYYDLPLLALPLIWWARAGAQEGWRAGESVLLAAFWLSPLLLLALAEATMVQFWPLAFTLLLAIVLHRFRHDPDGGATGGAIGAA
jgi:hypothetical protein